MISRVRLKGWRSHWDSMLEFSEGTNALIGIMGSGKSSVMDAISFALFGTFPSLQARRLVLDDIIMKRPQRMQKAEVLLEFEHDGASYQIRRIIERDGARQAEIRKDGRLLDSGVTKVTDAVERILRTDYDVFSRAVYAEQNGLDYFLALPKGQRMKRVDALLQIDRFEAARTTCTTVLNRIRDSVRDKSALVKEMENGEEFKRMESLGAEIEGLENKRGEMRMRENETASQEARVLQELDAVRSKELELRSLEVQIARSQGVIKTLEDETAAQIDAEHLGKELQRLREALSIADRHLREAEAARLDAEKIKQRLELATEEAKRQIAQLEAMGATCPLCKQPISEEHRKQHASKLHIHVEELQVQITEAEKSVAESASRVEEKSIFKETMREEISRVDKEAALAEQIRSKRTLLEQQRKVLEEARQRKEQLKSELEGVSMEEKQTLLRALSAALAELRAELRGLEATLRDRAAELSRLEERKMLFDKHREQIKRMEALTEDLRKFYAALEQTQLTLRREFVEAVNVTMSSLWDTLYPYEDYIDVRLGVEEGDYVLQLKENGGGWVPVEGVASGGERTTALLALRMAFALVLAPNLRWLVLDEPTHNLDANAVEQLAEVLRDHIGEYVDQVFLITHDEKLENAVTGYLYKLEREREKNEPTRVACVLSPRELEVSAS